MSTPAIALFAAVTALVLAILVGVVAIRVHRRTELKVQHAVQGLGGRIERLATELTHGLEQLDREHQLLLALGALHTDAGLSPALASVADAALGLARADAAMVCLVDDAGDAHVAAQGVPDELPCQPPVLWPSDGPRAVRLAFDHSGLDGSRLRTGIAVPLGPPAREQSSIAVFWVDQAQDRGVAVLDLLESLAQRVAPRLVDAHRARPAQVTPIDSVTGLASRQAFHELLRSEIATARRSRVPLTLLVLDVDDFRSVGLRLGELAADDVLRDIAQAIDEALPPGSASCRVGGDEFAAILPNSSVTAAEAVIARVQASLGRRSRVPGPALAVSAGITELADADDVVSVFERAKQALHHAKETSEGRSVVVMRSADVRR